MLPSSSGIARTGRRGVSWTDASEEPHQIRSSAPPLNQPPTTALFSINTGFSISTAEQVEAEINAARTSPIARAQPKRLIKLRVNPNERETFFQAGYGSTVGEGKRDEGLRPLGLQGRQKGKGIRKSRHNRTEEDTEAEKENAIRVSEQLRNGDLAAMPSLEAAPPRKRTRRTSSNASREKVNGHSQQTMNGTSHLKRKPSVSKPITNGNGNSTTSHPPKSEQNTSTSTNASVKLEKEFEKSLERNIDTVIFGDTQFKAWYPSWYPKEIIGEKALSLTEKSVGITVNELYVCKKCFGYSKVLLEWAVHCRNCEKEVPGKKIYTHGGEGEGRWSLWEVDGEVETVSYFIFPLSPTEYY